MAHEIIKETVPSISPRLGDTVFQGKNNAAIVLGRDRVTGIDTGYGSDPGAGALYLVTGLKSDQMSLSDDKTSIYMSMKTDIDDNAGTANIGTRSKASPGMILRSDHVRVIARESIKISVGKAWMTMTSDGSIILDGDIKLGNGATERLLKGESFSKVFEFHTHPSPVGPTGVPIQKVPESVYSTRRTLIE